RATLPTHTMQSPSSVRHPLPTLSSVHPPQSRTHTVYLRLANGLQMIVQGNNRGHNIERLYSGLEAFDLALHNGFCALGLPPAISNMRRDRLLKIIDVVNENSIEIVHLRGHIARHRNIDKKHGAVLTPAQEEFAMLPPEDGVRRTG